jgi:acylglycerol lipase
MFSRFRLLAAVLSLPLLLSGCATRLMPAGPPVTTAEETDTAFVMPDGMRLPYRLWRPEGEPRAIILALHGFNDSRDAWEIPAPELAKAGIEVIAPDQRGFGATGSRGYWPGTQSLVSDAREMARLIHAAHPNTKLFVMGESMGGAVAICLAASSRPGPVAGTILVSPAVWGRSEMNIFERAGLWLMNHTVPGMRVTGSMIKVEASDNRGAIARLSTDPLTIHETRWDSVNGLVDLMDAALADVGRMHGPALFLYGGKDDLIPKRAARRAMEDLPRDVQAAYYPRLHHLMLRDRGREAAVADILTWIGNPSVPLPSGAETRAERWEAGHPAANPPSRLALSR